MKLLHWLVLCIHFTVDLKLQTKGWWSLLNEITFVTKVVALNTELVQVPPYHLLLLNAHADCDLLCKTSEWL